MTKQQKIILSASRDIPFNKLMLSQSNVRRVKAGVSIEELAEDVARRTLLSSITVRPVLDDSGAETGMYTIPAGGRRFRSPELLVKQKRMNKSALVPCIVRTVGLAEEGSLAENVQRAPLHPLDQFRAFQAMREKGRIEEEIAAAFFVLASVVKQRLKLAAIAPSLLDAYAEEEMTLDQLRAFTVNPDHARQEFWEALQRHYSRQPYEIRRMLTEGAVRASDKRAQFVGLGVSVVCVMSAMPRLARRQGWPSRGPRFSAKTEGARLRLSVINGLENCRAQVAGRGSFARVVAATRLFFHAIRKRLKRRTPGAGGLVPPGKSQG